MPALDERKIVGANPTPTTILLDISVKARALGSDPRGEGSFPSCPAIFVDIANSNWQYQPR